MGTTKSGRYLSTKGSSRRVSEYALVHSIEGGFRWRNREEKGKKRIRLDNGGHGQKGIELLDKYGIEYNIVKTYSNGVRVGCVPDHGHKAKRSGIAQSWFPETWTNRDLVRAGEHVAGLRRNRNVPDGTKIYGVYKGVRVGVIRTGGKIATIFPDSYQNATIRKRKKS